MKVLFIGGLYPDNKKSQIMWNSKRGIQFAADNFQHSLIHGFIENGVDMSIVSFPFISSFPFGYKKLFVKGGNFQFDNLSIGKMVSFINFPFMRFKFNNFHKIISEILNDSRADEVFLIIYSLQQHLLQEAFKLKRDYQNVKICLVSADLPEYMGCNRIYKLLGLKACEIKYISNNIEKADYYILLTDFMSSRLNIVSKKWVRIEGIYSEKNIIEAEKKERKKTVLYSGALQKKYGLETLLDAFGYIESDDYQLWLCGDGDFKEELVSRAQLDKRITYWGVLPFSEVLRLQKKATLLINPRTSYGEYTKYSFPSKTMEYLASGTPALLYQLPGIPEEYTNFFYAIDEHADSYTISKEIVKICNKPFCELIDFGNKAAQFVMSEKNSKKQVLKILKMFNPNI